MLYRLKTRQSVGIELADQRIRILQAYYKRRKYHIDKVSVHPLPSTVMGSEKIHDWNDLQLALFNTVHSLGLKGSRVAVAIADAMVQYSSLEISHDKTDRQILTLLRQQEVAAGRYLDFVRMTDDQGRSLVHCASVPKQEIDSLISIFEVCGLRLRVVDTRSGALQNAAMLHMSTLVNLHAFIYIRDHIAMVLIYSRDGVVDYQRWRLLSEETFIETILQFLKTYQIRLHLPLYFLCANTTLRNYADKLNQYLNIKEMPIHEPLSAEYFLCYGLACRIFPQW